MSWEDLPPPAPSGKAPDSHPVILRASAAEGRFQQRLTVLVRPHLFAGGGGRLGGNPAPPSPSRGAGAMMPAACASLPPGAAS